MFVLATCPGIATYVIRAQTKNMNATFGNKTWIIVTSSLGKYCLLHSKEKKKRKEKEIKYNKMKKCKKKEKKKRK